MRLVLAAMTMISVMFLEINTIPSFRRISLETAATANPVPEANLAKASTPTDDAQPEEMAALAKGDRLFPMRPREDALQDDPGVAAPADNATPVADAQPPELTTGEFCEALKQAAEDSAIPVAFFARLIWQESKFKHDATSPVGAQGVAQFMPQTAAEMGLDDPYDPRKALPASARFLRKLHDQFGNLGLAAAAYNAGSGRIQNWLARRGPLPDETRDYVRKITGAIAEKWTAEKQTVALQVDLPREAPCEGVGGLSRAKDTEAMPVALTPVISGIIRKAEAEARAAAAAAKERIRVALLKSSKRRALATRLAAADKAKASDKAAAAEEATSEKSTAKKQVAVIDVAKAKVTLRKSATVRVAALGHRSKADARRVKVASAGR